MKAGFVALAAATLVLAGCGESGGGNATGSGGPAKAPIPAPNGGDWSQTVAPTPEGGFRMGNPDAPVKLIEFASISCGHCAEFAEAATQPLVENYVKTGNVSWEYRPYMIFPTDPGIFMLLRCRGAGPFFQLTEQLYATQRDWLGRIQQLPQADVARIQALPPAQQTAALVQATGVDAFFRQRGMPEAQVNQCLANGGDLQQLAQITSQAQQEYNVTGTPTFAINGEVVPNTGDWRTLEPALKAAVGG
jgi:protein-disulfide isomerase